MSVGLRQRTQTLGDEESGFYFPSNWDHEEAHSLSGCNDG
jgi:hypothetical protein